MKLFLISQDKNSWYDTYDSCVVSAPDEETARNMLPFTPCNLASEKITEECREIYWCCADYVDVTYIGEYVGDDCCILLSSLNAG